YSFMVPHDVPGLIKLHGGNREFTNKLQAVFGDEHYDATNEPNIGYPDLFSYVKGEEWRTQPLTQQLLTRYLKNSPNGLPGNDDTGTMSAWAVFSMMGFYPDNATEPFYTFTTPIFDRITLRLNPDYYDNKVLEMEIVRPGKNARFIDKIVIDGKKFN